MLVPIDPQSLRIVQAQKERELERYIELLRTAKEMGTLQEDPTWFAQAWQSLKARVFTRTPARKRASQPGTL